MLVDTSVWILWLRGQETAATRRLDLLLEEGEAWLAPVGFQELLQGTRSPLDLERLRSEFVGQPFLPVTLESHARAGELYARCRWQGITIRSPHDCLIAALAMEHELYLLQEDRDFERIAEVAPDLRLWRGG